jgi:putative PEP-CTERM system histidine kinase
VRVSIRLSRQATFQSLSLAAIGVYLLLMWGAAVALDMAGKNYGDLAQLAFIAAGLVAGIVLTLSASLRGWMRVTIAKHFFRLRYDYRVEWTRFTDTIGHPGDEENSFHERVIKAVADITDSPAGILLTPDESGFLMLQARWNWSLVDVPREAASIAAALYLEESGRILIFDELRDGRAPQQEIDICPEWIMQNNRIWLGLPCVHYGRLAGLILLQRPSYAREPDWEDRDLLRVVARQIASYLSEARGQETLSEVKRFDEFNRRFAFIMHDVKNLVSQLSLVAKNAEKHAGNPEFQADMLHTIQHSVGRMNDLLARLSQHNKGKAEEPRPMDARKIIDAIVREKRLLHPLMTGLERDLMLMADPNRAEQILGHLVQNAIDASPSDEPVHIMARDTGGDIAIDVLDRGCGMSPEFVRTQLFRPFTSTKEGGFGIGSYEARQLAIMLGGRIEVESIEGEGSRFTLYLPKVDGSGQNMSRNRDTIMSGQEAA